MGYRSRSPIAEALAELQAEGHEVQDDMHMKLRMDGWPPVLGELTGEALRNALWQEYDIPTDHFLFTMVMMPHEGRPFLVELSDFRRDEVGGVIDALVATREAMVAQERQQRGRQIRPRRRGPHHRRP